MQNTYRKNTRIMPCFFHFSQCIWRKASKLGLRQKEVLLSTKELILNLKCLAFIDLDAIENRFSMIKEKFGSINKFEELLKYFEINWIKEKNFKQNLWNYSKGVK